MTTVRFDASGDALSRSANIPPVGSFTILVRAKRSAARGADSTIIAIESSGGASGEYAYVNASNVLGIYCSNSGAAAFASTPAVGVEFDLALVKNSTTVTGYWKAAASSTWITTSGSGVTTWTPVSLILGNDSTDAWHNGTICGAKVWDRALTDAELLVESFYERVMYPSSLNAHWPIKSASDLSDYSGGGRSLTAGGTLTTEDSAWQSWKPGARVLRRAGAPTFIASKIHQLRQQGFL